VTPKSGLLRIDRAAIAADAKLDGEFLLRTSDPTLDAEDVALGYKQLLQVERGWRDLKLHLDLRPVFHRREDRIRAHVLLCWLALLVTRIAENAAGDNLAQPTSRSAPARRHRSGRARRHHHPRGGAPGVPDSRPHRMGGLEQERW
jgi:hypothetical protein